MAYAVPKKAVKFNHSLTHSLNMLESLLCILNIIDIISCFDWPGGRVINICIGYVVISLMHKALKQDCHSGDHHWYYYPGTLYFNHLWNSIKYRTRIDFNLYVSYLKWIAETLLLDCLVSSPINGHQSNIPILLFHCIAESKTTIAHYHYCIFIVTM